ncbi:hypothetical protein [Helicobacter pylori]|uniref:hypothetical protein n=1 Tax=Helicobacter pylori TaxID=210 RepID=UPI00165CB15B|nr:hypothetical protein [Helicobacter pylori]
MVTLKGTIKLQKNDLLLNPSLVETGTKGNFYKLLEWLYLKMDADNKVDNKKA